MYTLMEFFRETISRPLEVLRHEIFIRATDWPRLPSAHPNWDGGPPPQKKLIAKIKNLAWNSASELL